MQSGDKTLNQRGVSRSRCMTSALLTLTLIIGAATAKADTPTPQEARIGYVSLKVLDLQRSLNFYSTLLGMKETRRLSGGNGVAEVLIGATAAADRRASC